MKNDEHWQILIQLYIRSGIIKWMVKIVILFSDYGNSHLYIWPTDMIYDSLTWVRAAVAASIRAFVVAMPTDSGSWSLVEVVVE